VTGSSATPNAAAGVDVAEETHLALSADDAGFDASAGAGPNLTTYEGYYSRTKQQMTTTDGGHTPTPPSSAPYHIALRAPERDI